MAADFQKMPLNNSFSGKAAFRTRHAARELSLQVLFQWDFHKHTDYGLDEFWKHQRVAPDVRSFANQLIQGVCEHYLELDRVINRYATNWTTDRMPVVDRNLLRQAIYELFFLPEIPARVTVNEALQLAKSFADDETRRFVNGMLDQILKKEPRLEKKFHHSHSDHVPPSDRAAAPSSASDQEHVNLS